MARILGFRAEAKQFYWALVEGTRREPILVAHDKAAAPVDLDEAAALSWFRERVRLLIQAHKPDGAALRSPEPVALGGNKEGARRRLRVEGVLLEATDSCRVTVTAGALAKISAQLGTKSAKAYLKHGELRGLDVSKLPTPAKESVLVAVARLPEP
jgi:hypothetical protein